MADSTSSRPIVSTVRARTLPLLNNTVADFHLEFEKPNLTPHTEGFKLAVIE